ncbi:hypothetical protein Ancab_028113 [Ancistrocladus abbreviatus]
MALLFRIKQVKLNYFSHQVKRCYFQFSGGCLANYVASVEAIAISNNPRQVIHRRPTQFFDNVRLFAAPVQAKKEEEKDPNRSRINEEIRAEFVRLVTDQGHGVVSRREALQRAKSLQLDLVEVQRNAKPPVCKIMDYHRERYKQQVKEKERTKSKSEVTLRKGDCKEIRFYPKTELKDLKIKADTVKRLMDRGYRVKCMAMGTEDQDLGGLLSCLFEMIEDVSFIESGPRVEKKQAYVIVRHIKFGPSKKGGKKASKIVDAMSSEIPEAAMSMAASSPSGPSSPVCLKKTNSEGSDLENDDEVFSGDSDTPTTRSHGQDETTWSVFETNNNIDEVFDLSEGKKVASGLGDEQIEADSVASFSHASTNFSDLQRPRMPNLTGPNANSSSSSQEPEVQTENRYKRTLTRNSPGRTDSWRFPNKGSRVPVGFNVPSAEETKRVMPDASGFRNSRLPQNAMPWAEISNQGRQFDSRSSISSPPEGSKMGSKQEPNSNDNQGSPSTSYGIFRSQETSFSRRQGLGEINSGGGGPFDFARKPGGGRVSGNPNPPTSRSDSSQIPGINGSDQWGIFSRENSDSKPSWISEDQGKVQR